MQRIADADTLAKKRSVELTVMRERLKSENNLKEPIDDEYGMDRINAMIADIEADYAARVKDAGSGAADEEEDGDISEGF
jgi:uncharacterized protein YeeX (DUF496 family)